jgi:hypothetical protein
MSRSRAQNKDQKLLQVVKDPTMFAEAMLGHQVWSRQDDILQSMANHARTAVKACHASGKTFTAAEAVLWWITSRQKAVAVTTAPTWTQVERLLWGEIHNALYGARIKYPKPTATSLQLGPGRYAIGLSTKSARASAKTRAETNPTAHARSHWVPPPGVHALGCRNSHAAGLLALPRQ